jgi:hypothetical protein
LAAGWLILTGCGPSPARNAGTFVPIRPDPTATPTLPVSGSPPPPTSVVSDQVHISRFTHSSQRFSLNYPENWQPFEQPNGVQLIEPDGHAGYTVLFTDLGQPYTPEELGRLLVSLVRDNFVKKEEGFEVISQETQANGSIVARFSTIDPNLGQTINEVRLWQQETLAFIVLISATTEQWAVSQRSLQSLADTLTVHDAGPVAQTTPTTTPPTWELIGPASNRFGFFYPSNWQVARQDENVVTVVMPEQPVTFEAQLITGKDTPEAAAQAFIDTLAGQSAQFDSLPPAEFPLDTLTGLTVDFLYTPPNGPAMAGTIIVAGGPEGLYQIVFTAPAEFFEPALQWFNPMYQSFRILNPADLVPQ